MKKIGKYLVYYLLVALCAIFIGFASWVFLYTVNTILHFLWLGHEGAGGILYVHKFIIIPYILIGSFMLSIIHKHYTVIPKPGLVYAKEFKESNRVDYKGLVIVYFLAMAPIALGSSVGPEAALIGILFMMSSFIGDITVFLEKKFNIKYNLEASNNFKEKLLGDYRYTLKIIILYAITAITLVQLTGADKYPSFYVKLPPITLEMEATLLVKLIYVILVGAILLAIGYFFGKFYEFSEHKIEKYMNKITNIHVKTVLTGAILSVFALTLPVLIMSGEATLHVLVENPIAYTGVALIVLAFLKIILTHICISGNLRGGHIFPIIFSAFLLGTAISVLTGVDTTLSIASVTVGMTLSIFSTWIGVFLLLALFFPIKILFILFIIALIVRERIAAEKNESEI